jgi:hypothetical protein
VDLDDEAKIIEWHLHKAFVAQDPGVVNQNVDAAPFLHGLLDHVFNLGIVSNVSAMANRLTTSGFNFRDYCICIRGFTAIVAKVIYNDSCTTFCERQRVTSTQTLARSRDDGHLAV